MSDARPTPCATPEGGPAQLCHEGPTTVGVIVPVPDPFGARVRQVRRSVGDHRGDEIPTHITVIPPILVEGATMPLVRRHLEELTAGITPFRVRLRGVDTFRPVTPVEFVRVDEGAQDCAALAGAVNSGPLAAELAYPYHPHVTLAHHVPDAELDRAAELIGPVDETFTVVHVVLYQQDEGQVWRPLEVFRLRG